MKDTEDDLREGEDPDGVRSREGVTPLAPWSEFIEAFLRSVGVVDRVPRLTVLGLRWRGLRDSSFPLGEEDELLRCG